MQKVWAIYEAEMLANFIAYNGLRIYEVRLNENFKL